MGKEEIKKAKEEMLDEVIEMLREQAKLCACEGKDSQRAEILNDIADVVGEIEILNTYTITEQLYGRYTQNVYVKLKAKSKEDALKKYERLDLSKYSVYDYDCEDGTDVEVS